MAELQVPPGQERALVRFLSLDQTLCERLLDALSSAKPRLLVANLATDLSSKVGMDEEELHDVLEMLTSLYVSLDRFEGSVEEFAGMVVETLRKMNRDDLTPTAGDWVAFQGYLARILSLHDSLGVTSKANEIMFENERVYCDARIVSDLRPVFRFHLEGGPAGAVVVHSMRLTYHEGRRLREFYIAMDKDDVEQLKKLLNRAEKKHEMIKALAARSGVNVIES